MCPPPHDEHSPFSLLKEAGFSSWFKKAEQAVKEVEYIHVELTMPAVNELRYAGYHIANFLDNPAAADELDRAIGHCKRAIYDAYEASILYQIKEFRVFNDDYRNIVVSEVLADYNDIHHKVTGILDFIRDTDKETKDEHYSACKQHHNELKEIIKRLNSAREELNKKIRSERKKSFISIITVVVAVFALIVAIASYLGCP